MFDLEFEYWWYRGLDQLLLNTLKKLDLGFIPKVLDAGCGTGRVLKKLFTDFQAFGIDYSNEALKFCKQHGLNRLCLGTLLNAPYRSSQFDLIISMDVLYHEGISDDQAALREFYRILKPGGKLILHLPALEILRGQHDAQVNTRERYTKTVLLKRVRNSGFNTTFVTYRLFPLLPLFAMRRLCSRNSRNAESDLFPLPSWINSALYGIVCLENLWLRRFSSPIGSSLFLVAEKGKT